jgi:hypothetical protein
MSFPDLADSSDPSNYNSVSQQTTRQMFADMDKRATEMMAGSSVTEPLTPGQRIFMALTFVLIAIMIAAVLLGPTSSMLSPA